MDEIVTDPSPPRIETPVLDNALFLLRESNRDFLNGKRDVPILGSRASNTGLATSLLLVFLFIGLCQVIDRMRSWLLAIDLPPLSTAWIDNQSLLFALFGVLVVMGVLVVVYDMYFVRRRVRNVAKANALTPKKAELPVIPARQPGVPAKAKGLVLTGEVVHAEKIRHEGRNDTQVKVGVRYRFAAPGGVLMEGRAEGDMLVASHDMAPLPGTPIRVWYTDNEKFYLL